MIFIDEPRRYDTSLRYKVFSHMWSNECDQELHEMADRIGLRREWFQSAQPNATAKWRRWYNHYDVTPRLRMLAIQHGAQQIDREAYVEMVRKVWETTVPWSRAESYADATEQDMLGDPAYWANVGLD